MKFAKPKLLPGQPNRFLYITNELMQLTYSPNPFECGYKNWIIHPLFLLKFEK